MEELEFRIVIVPRDQSPTEKDQEEYLTQYGKYLQSCELKNIKLNILKIERAEDEDYPEVEEFILQAHAFLERSGFKPKSYFYKSLFSKWKHIFFPKPSPLLLLHTNNSFSDYRQVSHLSVGMENLAFGVLPFNGEFYQYASLQSHYKTDFLHDERKIIISYASYELTFTYNNIRNIFVNIETEEVFFDLGNPPLIFSIEKKLSSKGKDIYVRRLAHNLFNKRKEKISSDILGRSNILRFTFLEPADEIISRIHFRCSEKPIHYGYIVSISKASLPIEPNIEWKHYGCAYLLSAIFRRNFTMAVQTPNITVSLFNLLVLSMENEDCLERALTLVLAAIDTGKVVNFWLATKKLFYFYVYNKNEVKFGSFIVPDKCQTIRRVTVTPTRQILWPPEVVMGNRVIRNFGAEYSLRVTFRDDNHSRLSFHVPNALESVFNNAIRKHLFQGIDIGSRHFEFLAWSNSQIRDHGVWMFAKDKNGNTAKCIRAWMGDFSHIHSVSKYMARMGQCFSQTEEALSVPFNSLFISTEEDIEGDYDAVNKKRYCFSDGIGKISSSLADIVHETLEHDKLCCAFQIRYGGYKGMLVLDPTLKDPDIIFRKSMKKFDSPESIKLEIARTSGPTPLQLNRPFITILNDLGVRHRTFLKLQEDMLRNLTDMLIDEKKSCEYLNKNTPTNLFNFKSLSKSGIYLTTEPFFRSLLLALHRNHVDKIKTKANLAIDPNKGRNMLGVLDETGLLKEGQVFVQYTKDLSKGTTTKNTVVLTGTVVVTKNPCFLPGDVRKFIAVDVPELQHIVDCIAFPRRGKRPHPNEMSGADLDGDEFTVLWDEDLIFHCQNHPPGEFYNPSSETKEKITVEDMIDFFIQFIKNDQVGSIASAHLAQADQTSIFSDVCLSIANKFSYAVDFAKTGVSTHLHPTERPIKFPDFMERHYQESYKSKKALGKMYRVIKDYESENEEASLAYCDIQVDKDLVFPGWEKFKSSALESRKKYFSLLKTVLRNYGIEHEAEIFSGAFSNLHCRFRDRKDKKEIEKIVILSVKHLVKCMKEEFFEEFAKIGDVSFLDISMLQKASAWYVVTYSKKNPKLLSFPWIVSECLANIKVKRYANEVLPFSPIIAKMDNQIDSHESKYKIMDDFIENQSEKYTFFCDPDIIRKALGVLLVWAHDEHIVTSSKTCKRGEQTNGLMFRKTFIKLFLYVTEVASYITKETNLPSPIGKHYSAASLCLEFLRFCLKLRFYNKQEVLEVIPFKVYKYTDLSKRAVVAFHRFAVLGEFQNLYRDFEQTEDAIEMKPIYIESKLFSNYPISTRLLQNAQVHLRKYCDVDDVWMREIRMTKKVLVSAFGTEQSLKSLRCILRKKPEKLSTFLTTGKGIETSE